MGEYEKRLYKVVNSPGFKRLFLGECKNCGKKIWSIGEEIDVDKGTIKAKFLCNCGAKYKKTMYSREHKHGYACQQGLVSDMMIKGKSYRVIHSLSGIYLVTPKGIKVKKKKGVNYDEKN